MTTSGFYNWSTTSSTNATADGTINWAEGQAPSSINDSARAMMSRLREWGNDISGSISTGGTSTAYTVTSNQAFDSLAHLNGQIVAFVPNATSTNTVGNDVTLNVDGLGAKPIRVQPSVALPSGSLILGTPYVVVYNSSDAVFYLHNMTNPYQIPLGAGMDYWGSSTPNSAFAFPTGQAISRTTYDTLFSLIGTTYGTGDGSTTFNLPDKTGRVSAMKESSATRLTSGVSGVDGGTLGANGGVQSRTIAQGNLPNVSLALSGSIPVKTGGVQAVAPPNNAAIANFTNSGAAGTYAASAFGSISADISSGTAALGGSGTALPTCQPTIICNYIMRVI